MQESGDWVRLLRMMRSPRLLTPVFLMMLLIGDDLAEAQQSLANYDESAVGEYVLPELLKLQDGTPVTSIGKWVKQRRPEVLGLFRDHVYGRTPKDWGSVNFEVKSTKADALGGLATRKLVQITLVGKPEWEGIELMLYVPNEKANPAPCFVGLSFGGNHAVATEADVPISKKWMRPSKEKGVVDNRATEASRGTESSRWPLEMILKRGYAVATAYCGDMEPDHAEGWRDGVRAVLSPDGKDTVWGESDWGAIGAWAWGLSRMLDYLETDADVDSKHCAVIGHSRLGKTSLWAGAQDERFALVISNDSGEGGAATMRRNFGETTEVITRAFPHWFAPKYRSYKDDASACPVDQHMLIALAAPRPIYVASAAEDRWADPKGEFLSAKHAGPVYALFGKEGVGVEEQPPIDQSVGETVGYHIRTGEHNVLPFDWQSYMDFADRHGFRE